MSAEAEIKSFVERVLRIKAEQDELAQDAKEIYKEAKSRGFNTKVISSVVGYIRKRERKPDDIAEQDALFEPYLAAYEGRSRVGTENAPRAALREASGSSNGRTPEFDSGNGGSNPSPETTTNSPDPHSFEVDDGQLSPSANVPSAQKTAALSAVGRDGDKPGHCNDEFAQQSDSAVQVGNEAESASGSSVTHSEPQASSSQPAMTAGEVGSSPISPAFSKTIRDYRPHCQHPENCAASDLRHCGACQRIADAAEACEAVA